MKSLRLFDREFLHHAVIAVRLAVFRIRDEADHEIVARGQIGREVFGRSGNRRGDSADRVTRWWAIGLVRRVGLLHELAEVLHRLARGKAYDLDLVRLWPAVHELERVIAGGDDGLAIGDRDGRTG